MCRKAGSTRTIWDCSKDVRRVHVGRVLNVLAQFVEFDTNDYLPDGC